MINFAVTLKRLKKYTVFLILLSVLSIGFLVLNTGLADKDKAYKPELQIYKTVEQENPEDLINHLSDDYTILFKEENNFDKNTLVVDDELIQNLQKVEPLRITFYGDQSAGDSLLNKINTYHLIKTQRLDENYTSSSDSTIKYNLIENQNSLLSSIFYNTYLIAQLAIPITITLLVNKKRSNVVIRQQLVNKNKGKDKFLEFLGIILFLSIPILLINIGTFIIMPDYLDYLPSAIINQTITLLGALVLGYFATTITKNSRVSYILSIVIPLVIGFSSGSWLPINFIQESPLRFIGFLFPMYWGNLGVYNFATGSEYLLNILIAFGLIIFYFFLARGFEKFNRTNQVFTSIE